MGLQLPDTQQSWLTPSAREFLENLALCDLFLGPDSGGDQLLANSLAGFPVSLQLESKLAEGEHLTYL